MYRLEFIFKDVKHNWYAKFWLPRRCKCSLFRVLMQHWLTRTQNSVYPFVLFTLIRVPGFLRMFAKQTRGSVLNIANAFSTPFFPAKLIMPKIFYYHSAWLQHHDRIITKNNINEVMLSHNRNRVQHFRFIVSCTNHCDVRKLLSKELNFLLGV